MFSKLLRVTAATAVAALLTIGVLALPSEASRRRYPPQRESPSATSAQTLPTRRRMLLPGYPRCSTSTATCWAATTWTKQTRE